MEDEVIVSGFCKAQNQTRMVICEVQLQPEGGMEILDTDCAYGKCPHTDDCLLIRNARSQ